MDEIDVSKCRLYCDSYKACMASINATWWYGNIKTGCIDEHYNNGVNFLCVNNPDCYFRQLQQLKQENEELKEQIKFLLEYKKKAMTCEECYTEGVETGKNITEQKLKRIEEIADRPCSDGCKCIDKTDILQIIEGIK